jgi:RND family efflux transporter MFP subunit
VPQAFSAGLTAGEKVTFDMPQYPGRHFEATLVTTSRAMDANSRSMTVELQADNADGKFAAGTYAQVHFPIAADPNIVVVPATALMPVDHGVEVAVLGDGGKALFKTVQLGRDFGDRVEVVAGLAPQDRVIDSPPETLQNGDAVQLAAAPSGHEAATQSAANAR